MPVSKSEALESLAQHALSSDEASSDDDDQIERAPSSASSGTVCRFFRAAEKLSQELGFFVLDSHEIGGDGRGYAVLRLVEAETREAREWLRASRK